MEKIKSNKKLLIIGAITILLIAIVAVVIMNKNNNKNPIDDPGKKEIHYNTNEKVVEDKNINNIAFTDIECSYDGNSSLLKYTITNHTGKTINLGEYEIIVKDKEGNVIANLAPVLDYDIGPEKSFETGNAINIDLRKAYSIELVLDKEEKES